MDSTILDMPRLQRQGGHGEDQILTYIFRTEDIYTAGKWAYGLLGVSYEH